VSSEISDLFLFVSCFASQNKEIKFDNYVFDVFCKLKLFGMMSGTHNKLYYGNNFNIWKILDLSLRPQLFFFFSPNPTHLPKLESLSPNHQFSQHI